MSGARPGAPGATRTCPHCRATILESSSICPACRHHLRSDPSASLQRKGKRSTPLTVEGTITHPAGTPPVEYSVVVSITNEKGEEIARQIVGVGALHGNDRRSFTLEVEATEP